MHFFTELTSAFSDRPLFWTEVPTFPLLFFPRRRESEGEIKEEEEYHVTVLWATSGVQNNDDGGLIGRRSARGGEKDGFTDAISLWSAAAAAGDPGPGPP